LAKSSDARRKSARTAASAGVSAVFLQAVIDSFIDAIITIDDRGTVESFNPAAARIFGYAADEVIGNNVNMLMPEPYAGEHDGYLRNYHETGKARIIGIGREVAGLRKDGTAFPLDLAVTEMRIGKQKKFVGIIRDISERKQAEDLIERQSQSLLELSTPVIRIWDRIVLLPLIGVIDTARAQQIIENLLDAIVADEATMAIVDVTGVLIMDTIVAQHLLKTVNAAGMLGAKVIITGIRPEIAQTLTKLNVDFANIRTCSSLRMGMAEALAIVGKQVIAKNGG